MDYETIIVGAGPAGLQLGYFLQKGGHSYCILERAPAAASFFDRYPHSGKLISINKKHTGSDVYDFNLRHDWNSLLNDEKMSFTSYSDDYYPDKEDIVRYMNDFAGRFKLAIRYNHSVKAIYKQEDETYRLEMDASGTNIQATCKKLVMATGLSVPVIPTFVDNTKVRPKHYGEYPKDFFRKPENLELFRNKSVCIIGNGNAAYELASILTPYTSHTFIHGRRPKPWAASTHYTGDLRSIYLPFLDTFLLKSLNAEDWRESRILCLEQHEASEPYKLYSICSPMCQIKHTLRYKDVYDHVIFATGWMFDKSVFQFEVETIHHYKYPSLNTDFQSTNNRNLYFIGALMHELDYKKSSGGFIHGFRYLIEYFYNVHYKHALDIDIFKHTEGSIQSTILTVVNHIMYKINYTSGLYQMFGYLSDIFYYDVAKKEYIYFNTVPKSCVSKILTVAANQIVFQLTLEYGAKQVTDIYELGIQESKEPALANLLHPVLRVFRARTRSLTEKGTGPIIEQVEIVHFAEDLFAEFTHRDDYFNKLVRVIKGYLP